MSSHKHHDHHNPTKKNKLAWLDERSEAPLIDDYSQRLGSFLDAMADGRIDKHEVEAQEKRIVALMKEVEPKLDEELHEKVTNLLCELTAYNIMKTVHELTAEVHPRTKFRG